MKHEAATPPPATTEKEKAETTNSGDEKEPTTSVPAVEDESEGDNLAQQALGFFGKWFGHLPETPEEWQIHSCIAYDDCYPADNRDLVAEQEATQNFIRRFGKRPTDKMDWNTIHADAYLLLHID
jgi:hypothetical protein